MGMIFWYKYKHESSEEILSLVAVEKKRKINQMHTRAHTQPRPHVTLEGLVVSDFFSQLLVLELLAVWLHHWSNSWRAEMHCRAAKCRSSLALCFWGISLKPSLPESSDFVRIVPVDEKGAGGS